MLSPRLLPLASHQGSSWKFSRTLGASTTRSPGDRHTESGWAGTHATTTACRRRGREGLPLHRSPCPLSTSSNGQALRFVLTLQRWDRWKCCRKQWDHELSVPRSPLTLTSPPLFLPRVAIPTKPQLTSSYFLGSKPSPITSRCSLPPPPHQHRESNGRRTSTK